jgi:hypothetical protein
MRLPPTTLRAPAAVPPMRVPGESAVTPMPRSLRMAADASAARPTVFPWITVPVEPDWIVIPEFAKPPTRLPAPGAVPPIVVSPALTTRIPS